MYRSAKSWCKCASTPRNSFIKALLGSLKREKHERNKREYADRGVGSLLDGYCTTNEIVSISRYYMNLNTGSDLRNRMSHFLCHSCLLRENKGFTECRALVMITEQGKTNQYGRREFGSCIRHTNAEACPIGALALYFFLRWCVRMESIPDFLQPQKWYDVKVFRSGKDATTAMSYRAHYDATVKAFTFLNMYSKAKPHVARGSGSRMTELAGATDSQIRRLGRWNASAMEGCYLTANPREAMRSLAGFLPDRRTFFLERASLSPPENHQREIFPFVENYMSAYMQHSAPHIAIGVYLNLLLYLRIVILQDAVRLRDVHPTHKLWSFSPFNSSAFDMFATYLKDKIATEQTPQTTMLCALVPDLINHVKQQHQQTLSHIESKISEVGTSVLSIKETITQLTSGNTTVRLSVDLGS
ncbi:Short-chain dehydrogenase [Phytophthora palmivora]|uniref:Short-chain dehydrogenase n=1 Tax=Phytophthora palmivora TaxID=4796 RepID=A0A2P4YG86_9STRA|nr:Short-chain dehydrogenase [Phytophthora palmivora]